MDVRTQLTRWLPTIGLVLAIAWYVLVSTGRLHKKVYSDLNYDLGISVYLGVPLALILTILITEVVDTQSKLYFLRGGLALGIFLWTVINFINDPDDIAHMVGAIMCVLLQAVVVGVVLVMNLRSINATAITYRYSAMSLAVVILATTLVACAKIVEVNFRDDVKWCTPTTILTNASYGILLFASFTSYAYVSMYRPFDLDRARG
jgi:heme A synthase